MVEIDQKLNWQNRSKRGFSGGEKKAKRDFPDGKPRNPKTFYSSMKLIAG